ncbi:MAG: GNAT family N-acetyltransferase [Gammaproteobacteria bacterium]|nr:GNAT family N-acetyltransferase [Pseudomonadales bacterium]
MSSALIRTGNNADTEWLYQLFRDTNRGFIDLTWGWEELLQREAFYANLPGSQFRVLSLDGNGIGGYHLARKADHLWLEMILVKPQFQRRGYGTLMMNEIGKQALEAQLPVRLNVLRINPARHFYLAQGFRTITEAKGSMKMEWQA